MNITHDEEIADNDDEDDNGETKGPKPDPRKNNTIRRLSTHSIHITHNIE